MKLRIVLPLVILSFVTRSVMAQSVDRFLRGDVNGDGHVALSDAITVLQALFVKTTPLSCEDAADANDDGKLNVGDPVYMLQWLYRGGASPPAPGASECGNDPTFDSLLPCVAPVCRTGGETNESFASIEIEMPENRLEETGADLSNGRIADALELALNSPGDSITLTVKVSASVAIVALLNVGGERSFEAKISRTDDGFYEVSLGQEATVTAGVEIVEGLEANVGNRLGTKAIFKFQSVHEIARCLEQIGTALVLNPARGAALLVLQHAGEALAGLEALLGHASQLTDQLAAVERQIQELQGAVAQLDGWINAAQSELSGVLDQLADILGQVIGFFDKDLQRKLEQKKVQLESQIASWNRQRSALFQQVANAKAWKRQYEAALAEVRGAITAARSAVSAAHDGVELARSAIEALDFSQSSLKLRGVGLELTFSRTEEIEAELSPFPGASLEGLMLGAKVDGSLGITGRLDLDGDGDPSKLALKVAGQFGLEASASFGLGLMGDVKSGVEITFTFQRENGWYRKVDAKASLTVDAEILPSIGAGLVVRAGAGRKTTIQMDLVQLYERRKAVASFLESGNVEVLAAAFATLTATCKIEDRWIAQAELGFGFSIAGTGAAVGGTANWADVHQVIAAEVKAGELLRQLCDAARLQGVLRDLANQVQPVAP